MMRKKKIVALKDQKLLKLTSIHAKMVSTLEHIMQSFGDFESSNLAKRDDNGREVMGNP